MGEALAVRTQIAPCARGCGADFASRRTSLRCTDRGGRPRRCRMESGMVRRLHQRHRPRLPAQSFRLARVRRRSRPDALLRPATIASPARVAAGNSGRQDRAEISRRCSGPRVAGRRGSAFSFRARSAPARPLGFRKIHRSRQMNTQASSVTELLQKLVRIPSVNPDGNPGTDRTGEQACAEFVMEFLRSMGAEAGLHEVHPGRPNVVGRFASDPAKPRLLFAPHLDTVSVAGMTIDPFGGELRDGRVYGRGASDTKGPMASMLWALCECRDILPSLSHEIWFAGLMGEEAGQDGAKALVARERFDFVLVGEPTGLDVVFKHKVDVTARIVARGRAAHSSCPERGENAITKLASGLLSLHEALTDYFKTIEDPVLGHPTFSIGTIRGGAKFNIVPDYAEAVVDLRLLPSQWKADQAAAVFDAMRSACPGLEVTRIAGSEALDTDPSHPVIAKLAAAGGRPAGAAWFCDAAIFSAAGIPAAAAGPGSIAQAHTEDEYIEVAALEEGVEYFKKFLRSLRVG
ncbi:MAG: M20 family metallopeptidase [Chthoniobacterales bacterium]|nr:M20 family metallopeptidase [Chthoniobacterales bacterium]